MFQRCRLFIGPIIAANLFFGDANEKAISALCSSYIAIGMVVLLIAGLFVRTALPEIAESELVSESVQDINRFRPIRISSTPLVGQFLRGRTGGWAALFINY